MQVGSVTDAPMQSAVSTAKAPTRDFSADLQKAVDNQGAADLFVAKFSPEFLHYVSPSPYIPGAQEERFAQQASAKNLQDAVRAKTNDIAPPLDEPEKSEEVEAEEALQEGMIDPDAQNSSEDNQQNDESGEDNGASLGGDTIISTEDTATLKPDTIGDIVEETPPKPTPPSTTSEENSNAAVPPTAYPPNANYPYYPAAVPQTTGSALDYDELKQLLLMVCMAGMSGGSSDGGGMQGVAMMALMEYIGDMDALQADVNATAYAGGIDPYAINQMNRALFTSTENYPNRQSHPCNPLITSNQTNRNPALYAQVIAQFNVETNVRYKPSNSTWCNIFLWDVTSAMGAEIPHYVDRNTRAIATYPNTAGASELNANATHKWLKEIGPRYGWIEVSAEVAQQYANSGRPAVTAWRNPDSGHSGHVQVVCPSREGGFDPVRGVTVAQAGSRMLEYTYITEIFGEGAMRQLSYFVHA